jgi:hypothetical protein
MVVPEYRSIAMRSLILLGAIASSAALLIGPSAYSQDRCWKPIWSNLPSADALAMAYPGRAQKEHVDGWAVLRCAERADGRLVGCVVRSEGPFGFGFGAAALTLAPRIDLGGCADDPDRVIRHGVEVPVHFRSPS